MKKIHIIIALFCLCGLSVLTNSCQKKNADLRLVAGTLDEALPADSAPQHVQDAIVKAVKVHPFEIMNDEANSISVSGLGEAETTSTEGYGIMITKGAISTTFPNIRNVRQPVARYDSATGNLWLTSSAMEGSGVRVEWLYQIRFGDNDLAYVAAVLNPFDVQQALCQRLGFNIDGQNITFFDGNRQLGTATNTMTDMGGFDEEQPLWIGEQLFYDLSGDNVLLQVVPGVKFTTGLVLTYDDMPTLSLPVAIASDGTPTFGEIASF